MATQEIASTSVDYARSLVTWTGGNPTTFPIEMAFTTSPTSPPTNTYVTAAWENTTSAPYYAICLVGTGATVLAEGFYYKWIRVTNNPQIPAFPAGTLRITP